MFEFLYINSNTIKKLYKLAGVGYKKYSPADCVHEAHFKPTAFWKYTAKICYLSDIAHFHYLYWLTLSIPKPDLPGVQKQTTVFLKKKFLENILK